MKRNIPNFLTCINLLIGSIGIYFVLTGQKPEAIYFVLVAGLIDFLDGFAARLLNVKSEIGKQLDSLADLVSFGILPAFFMLTWMEDKTEFYWIAFLIPVFSALRLAKFNIDESQVDSFKGLPTPANAILLTSLVFSPITLYPYTLLTICLASCLLLVSSIPMLSLKFHSFGWRGNEARWILIIGVVALVVVFKLTSFPLIIPFYVGVSLASVVGKKKTE